MSSPSTSSPVEQMMKKGLSSHWEPTPLVEPFHLQIILQSTTTLKCLFFKEFLGQVNRKAFKNSHRQKVELIKFDGFYLHLTSFKYFDIKLYRDSNWQSFWFGKVFQRNSWPDQKWNQTWYLSKLLRDRHFKVKKFTQNARESRQKRIRDKTA